MRRVIRISISQAAFGAVAETRPLGSVASESQTDEKVERLIWLPPDVLAKLKSIRGPGEDWSDAIVRLAEAHAGR